MPSSGYSAAFVSLVQRMVSVNPADRPDASEILQSPVVGNYVSRLTPFSYNRQHLSNDECSEDKRKIIITVLCCVVYDGSE